MCFGKGIDRRPRELNELSGGEWAKASRSIEHYPDTRSTKQRIHGASFPESLASEQIGIYTKPGDVVLDPFVGVGTTLDAALALNRYGIGLDINARFISVARADLTRHGFRRGEHYDLATMDARRLRSRVALDSVDFVLTSPPYSSLLKGIRGDFAYKWREHSAIKPLANPAPYTTKGDDLGNMSQAVFLKRLSNILKATYDVSKSGAYSAWLVKDFRNLKASIPYVNFHGAVIECAQLAGFTLWDIRIVDQTKYRPLVCLGFPSRNFYLNIGHSYLLVFRKAA